MDATKGACRKILQQQLVRSDYIVNESAPLPQLYLG